MKNVKNAINFIHVSRGYGFDDRPMKERRANGESDPSYCEDCETHHKYTFTLYDTPVLMFDTAKGLIKEAKIMFKTLNR